MRTVAAAVAFALIAVSAHPAEITVRSAVPIDAGTMTVRAQRLDGAADAIERAISVPGTTSVALPEGLWDIRVTTDAFWAPPLFIRDGDAKSLLVWPAGLLRGSAKGTTVLRVAFTPLDPAGVAGETDCTIDSGSWSCRLPAGRHDLRFSSPGSAPEHRFAVAVPREAPIPLQFVAGASLSGRLEAVRGAKISLGGVEVSLTAHGDGQRSYTEKATARGFFQFKGLAPGRYSLRAQRAGLAAHERSVDIIAGAAAELNAPLLLDRPKRLSVHITPPLDPGGKPWHVELMSVEERPNGTRFLTAVAESVASPDGEWTHSGLPAGAYNVAVSRADGNAWKSQEVTIADADVTLPLSALSQRVAGIVTLAGKPLAASVSFGGRGGATLQSDDDGRFEGEIPPGDEEREVFVEAEALHVRRTLRVKFERRDLGERYAAIHLPATVFSGRVLREDGSPEPHALITVSGGDAHDFHQTFANDDGCFRLAGLATGDYGVTAEGDSARSERVHVRLSDEAAGEADLILRPQVVVRGRVGMGPVPLIGADVRAIPRDVSWAPLMPETVTNERGRFELKLPPRTAVYDLVAVHPAFDVITGRMTVEPKTTLHVVANQIGGTIVVDTQSPKDLLLRHDGGEYWAAWLARLAGGSADGSRVVLPRFEPGQYSARSAKTNRCVSGELPPHGTLSLVLD
ncbi:MAG TPA: carboxypeptidase-like regulatory domain-containing protein [Thermoanaerobaculia bacterium]|nr:carboxypeptidase-like regulatory domain-containing protein [Thermoanaerobaculia bacterium]